MTCVNLGIKGVSPTQMAGVGLGRISPVRECKASLLARSPGNRDPINLTCFSLPQRTAMLSYLEGSGELNFITVGFRGREIRLSGPQPRDGGSGFSLAYVPSMGIAGVSTNHQKRQRPLGFLFSGRKEDSPFRMSVHTNPHLEWHFR